MGYNEKNAIFAGYKVYLLMDLRNYETVFIITPVLSDSQVKDIVQKFKKLMTDHQVEMINEENWGLTKLAYPIQNKSNGYYILIEFKANTSFIKTLEVEYRRDERIMRFLTISLDKHAVAYNEKRRKGAFKKKSTDVKETVS